MEINPISFNYKDVVSALENPFIRSLSPIEYGKAVQTAVEEYVGYNVNLIAGEDLLVDVAKDPELMVEYQYANNGPGFDRLHLATKKKIQIKLRQVNGKTPYSKQVHFEIQDVTLQRTKTVLQYLVTFDIQYLNSITYWLYYVIL